jgi:hypothetical protein
MLRFGSLYVPLQKTELMETKYFALSATENNRLIKAIQIVFGLVCFGVAFFWLYFNIKSIKTDSTLWVTILFLSGFGFYMIWAGLGKATRFIEILSGKIRLKKSVLLPAVELSAADLEKIELHPFKIVFFMKAKKLTLRLSSTFYETNAKIMDEIWDFAELNKVTVEEMEEKI